MGEKKYTVVTGSEEIFDQTVNVYINKHGWVLQGGVSIAWDPNAGRFLYAQAMSK